MKRSTFLALTGFISGFFGIGLMVLPAELLGSYGLVLDAGTTLLARAMGTVLFSIGVLNYMVRNAPDSSSLQAILTCNLIIHALDAAVDLYGTTSGLLNASGWGSVVLHVVMGAGFLYFLRISSPKVAQ